MTERSKVKGNVNQSLLEFPCDYEFKAFGPSGPEFVRQVKTAAEQVVPVSVEAIRARPSSKGVYQCVSVVVRLHNQGQVVAIYAALKGIDSLKYLL